MQAESEPPGQPDGAGPGEGAGDGPGEGPGDGPGVGFEGTDASHDFQAVPHEVGVPLL